MNMHMIGASIEHSNQEIVTFSISPLRPGTRLFHIFCFATRRGHARALQQQIAIVSKAAVMNVLI